VHRVNDNKTYDIEFVGEYKWAGIQRGVVPEEVEERGAAEKKQKGEGLWHWEGMTDEEDDDFRADDTDEDENEDEEAKAKALLAKFRLTFEQFDRLAEVLAAAAAALTDNMAAGNPFPPTVEQVPSPHLPYQT
jgi:hypothetical protein